MSLKLNRKVSERRYVGDARTIAFYITSDTGSIQVLTGFDLSCRFRPESGDDINVPMVLVSGDGRARFAADALVSEPQKYSVLVTGTNAAGVGITPITGTLTVTDQ